MKYRIPREVSTELKIFKNFFLIDLGIVLILGLIRMITIGYVHNSLKIYYTIFLIILGIFLIIRPSTNPKKRMYQAILYAVLRKRDTYIAIDYNTMTKEGEKNDN